MATPLLTEKFRVIVFKNLILATLVILVLFVFEFKWVVSKMV